jgi:hypothetical protein
MVLGIVSLLGLGVVTLRGRRHASRVLAAADKTTAAAGGGR